MMMRDLMQLLLLQNVSGQLLLLMLTERRWIDGDDDASAHSGADDGLHGCGYSGLKTDYGLIAGSSGGNEWTTARGKSLNSGRKRRHYRRDRLEARRKLLDSLQRKGSR